MKIRFDVNDSSIRNELIGRDLGRALDRLTPAHRPRWGGFTAAQMVEHLLWGFEISTGQTAVSCSTSSERQGKARAFLHDIRPMPRGFENPLLREGVPPLRFSDMQDAIIAVRSEARLFLELQESTPASRYVHPVFGPSTMEEWSRVHFKHVVHHLLQFDLIDIEEVG